MSAEDRNVDFATAPADYTREDIDKILKAITNSGIEVHINQTDDGWMLAIDKASWKAAHDLIVWPMRKGQLKKIEFAEAPALE